jgi:hypothetical protein
MTVPSQTISLAELKSDWMLKWLSPGRNGFKRRRATDQKKKRGALSDQQWQHSANFRLTALE